MTHPDTPRPPMSETVKPLSQDKLDRLRADMAKKPRDYSWLSHELIATIADLEAKLAEAEHNLREITVQSDHRLFHFEQQKARAEKAERDLAQRREWRPTHRHLNSGNLYELISDSAMEVTHDTAVMSAVYRDEKGRMFVQRIERFIDGRFLPLPPPPTTGSAP